MTHFDRNQFELFAGPVIAGREIHPRRVNWLKREAIPQVRRLISDLESEGQIPPELGKQTRLGLLHALAKLNGEID